ncbi:MAG: acylphosphatase [Ignavibacteriae bacterium]|nr:acylphosphatase [Ignavibacteriota bacterium]
MKSFRIIISGVVQGVGFRYFCFKKAVEYNISGYAKNLINGDVEVIAQGEEGLVNDFVKELKIGPRYSNVKSVNMEKIDVEKEYPQFLIY